MLGMVNTTSTRKIAPCVQHMHVEPDAYTNSVNCCIHGLQLDIAFEFIFMHYVVHHGVQDLTLASSLCWDEDTKTTYMYVDLDSGCTITR